MYVCGKACLFFTEWEEGQFQGWLMKHQKHRFNSGKRFSEGLLAEDDFVSPF